MPVIGCLEIFQNGRSPQPITGIIYSPGPHELKIGSAVEDTLGFIPLVSDLTGGPSLSSARAIPTTEDERNKASEGPFSNAGTRSFHWLRG